MPSSHIRSSRDLLAYIADSLASQGRAVDPGMVIDLEPLFQEIYLGGETARLDQVVEQAVAAEGWLRPVGQGGRRFVLTPAGAEHARGGVRMLVGLSGRRRRVVVGLLLVAALVLLVLVLR